MKVSSVEDRAIYHCLSRVVDRRFIFGDAEKDTPPGIASRQVWPAQEDVPI